MFLHVVCGLFNRSTAALNRDEANITKFQIHQTSCQFQNIVFSM